MGTGHHHVVVMHGGGGGGNSVTPINWVFMCVNFFDTHTHTTD